MGYSNDDISNFIARFSGRGGVYKQVSTLAKDYMPSVDYRYQQERLSTAAPRGQQWTAKVEHALIEVDKRLHVLDPRLRYTH